MIRLDAVETARRLPYPELTAAIAHAARELAAGALNAPERLAVSIGDGACLLCMAAVAGDVGVAKIITVHPQNNGSEAAPVIQGEMVVFESGSGRRLMLLDGPTVTARRTAAVTLVAVEALAPHAPRSALLIGSGAQAAVHALALIEYFSVRSLWIAGTALSKAEALCEMLRARQPNVSAVPVLASRLPASGLDTDLVIALTTSRAPVVPASLPSTTLAIGVGAFRPDMAELPAELLRRRRVVVDYMEGARHEAGDLLRAELDWDEVSELSQLLDEDCVEPHTASVFKSVGHASWDLAAARVAMRSQGRGDV